MGGDGRAAAAPASLAAAPRPLGHTALTPRTPDPRRALRCFPPAPSACLRPTAARQACADVARARMEMSTVSQKADRLLAATLPERAYRAVLSRLAARRALSAKHAPAIAPAHVAGGALWAQGRPPAVAAQAEAHGRAAAGGGSGEAEEEAKEAKAEEAEEPPLIVQHEFGLVLHCQLHNLHTHFSRDRQSALLAAERLAAFMAEAQRSLAAHGLCLIQLSATALVATAMPAQQPHAHAGAPDSAPARAAAALLAALEIVSAHRQLFEAGTAPAPRQPRQSIDGQRARQAERASPPVRQRHAHADRPNTAPSDASVQREAAVCHSPSSASPLLPSRGCSGGAAGGAAQPSARNAQGGGTAAGETAAPIAAGGCSGSSGSAMRLAGGCAASSAAADGDASAQPADAPTAAAQSGSEVCVGVHCGHVVEGFASKLTTSGASFGVWGDAVKAAAALSWHMPAVARQLGGGRPSSGVLLSEQVLRLLPDELLTSCALQPALFAHAQPTAGGHGQCGQAAQHALLLGQPGRCAPAAAAGAAGAAAGPAPGQQAVGSLQQLRAELAEVLLAQPSLYSLLPAPTPLPPLVAARPSAGALQPAAQGVAAAPLPAGAAGADGLSSREASAADGNGGLALLQLPSAPQPASLGARVPRLSGQSALLLAARRRSSAFGRSQPAAPPSRRLQRARELLHGGAPDEGAELAARAAAEQSARPAYRELRVARWSQPSELSVGRPSSRLSGTPRPAPPSGGVDAHGYSSVWLAHLLSQQQQRTQTAPRCRPVRARVAPAPGFPTSGQAVAEGARTAAVCSAADSDGARRSGSGRWCCGAQAAAESERVSVSAQQQATLPVADAAAAEAVGERSAARVAGSAGLRQQRLAADAEETGREIERWFLERVRAWALVRLPGCCGGRALAGFGDALVLDPSLRHAGLQAAMEAHLLWARAGSDAPLAQLALALWLHALSLLCAPLRPCDLELCAADGRRAAAAAYGATQLLSLALSAAAAVGLSAALLADRLAPPRVQLALRRRCVQLLSGRPKRGAARAQLEGGAVHSTLPAAVGTPMLVSRVLGQRAAQSGFHAWGLWSEDAFSAPANRPRAAAGRGKRGARRLARAEAATVRLRAAIAVEATLAAACLLLLARALSLCFLLDLARPAALGSLRTAVLLWAASLLWVCLKLPLVTLRAHAAAALGAAAAGAGALLGALAARGALAAVGSGAALAGAVIGWLGLGFLLCAHEQHVAVCEAVAFTRRSVERETLRLQLAEGVRNELALQRSLLPPSFPLTMGALEEADMCSYQTGLIAVRLSGEASLYKVLSAADVLSVYTELYALLDALIDSTDRCEKASTFGLASEYLLLVHPTRTTAEAADERGLAGGSRAADVPAERDMSNKSCRGCSFTGGLGASGSESACSSFCARDGSSLKRRPSRMSWRADAGGSHLCGCAAAQLAGAREVQQAEGEDSEAARALNAAIEASLELVFKFERALERFNARHHVGLRVTVTVLHGAIVRGVLATGDRLAYCSWGRPFDLLAKAEAAARDLGVAVLLTRAQAMRLSRRVKRKLCFAKLVQLPRDTPHGGAPPPPAPPQSRRAARPSRNSFVASCANMLGFSALSRAMLEHQPSCGERSADSLPSGPVAEGRASGEQPEGVQPAADADGAAAHCASPVHCWTGAVGSRAASTADADGMPGGCGAAPRPQPASSLDGSGRRSARRMTVESAAAAASGGGADDERLLAFTPVGLGLGTSERLGGALTSLHLQYILGPALGRGAFSRVRLATSCASGERVAIKTLRKSALQLQHVQAELKILASLRGRQIVQLLHVVAEPAAIHLVLEYVNGVPLSQLCNRPRSAQLREGTVRKIAAQFALALESIHALGVLHRDIKPENAMLLGEYTLKLVDFGLSVLVQPTPGGPPQGGAGGDAEVALATCGRDGASALPGPLLNGASGADSAASAGGADGGAASGAAGLAAAGEPSCQRCSSEQAFGALATLQKVMMAPLDPALPHGSESGAPPSSAAGAGALHVTLIGKSATEALEPLKASAALVQAGGGALTTSEWPSLRALYDAHGGASAKPSAVPGDVLLLSLDELLPELLPPIAQAQQHAQAQQGTLARKVPLSWLNSRTEAPVIAVLQRAQLWVEVSLGHVLEVIDVAPDQTAAGVAGGGTAELWPAPETFGSSAFDALSVLLARELVHDYVLLPLLPPAAPSSGCTDAEVSSELVQMIVAARDQRRLHARARQRTSSRPTPSVRGRLPAGAVGSPLAASSRECTTQSPHLARKQPEGGPKPDDGRTPPPGPEQPPRSERARAHSHAASHQQQHAECGSGMLPAAPASTAAAGHPNAQGQPQPPGLAPGGDMARCAIAMQGAGAPPPPPHPLFLSGGPEAQLRESAHGYSSRGLAATAEHSLATAQSALASPRRTNGPSRAPAHEVRLGDRAHRAQQRSSGGLPCGSAGSSTASSDSQQTTAGGRSRAAGSSRGLVGRVARRVGTPPYMAPEVVTACEYSVASEYWALGCVLYELVTTDRLFDGPTVEVVLEKIAQRPDCSRKVMQMAGASTELKLFVAQLVAVDKNERLGVDPDDPLREHVFFTGAPPTDAFSWEEFT